MELERFNEFQYESDLELNFDLKIFVMHSVTYVASIKIHNLILSNPTHL